MRTSRVRIGSAIILGPFQHPIRFAEDVAFVDQLSGGRLEIGLGLGYRPREFELLGVPLEERARRTEALVDDRPAGLGRRNRDAAALPAAGAAVLDRRLGRRRPHAAPRGSAARSCPTPSSRPR